MDNGAIVDDFFWFDRLTDILFILDLIFNFFTGWVTKEGVVLMDHRVIVKKYLTSWFVVDLVSSIPFDVMIYYIAQHQNLGRQGDTLKFLEMVRMGRFYKLSRLLRLFRFVGVFTRLRGGFFLTHTSSNIIKFIIFSIFAMHWSACLFLSLDRDHCPAGWIEAVGLGGANAVDIYVASLYWSMATFMTIGYGDISARVRRNSRGEKACRKRKWEGGERGRSTTTQNGVRPHICPSPSPTVYNYPSVFHGSNAAWE